MRHLEKWAILAENHWAIVGRKLTRGRVPTVDEVTGWLKEALAS